ncbi:MAG TPA: NAD(P)/FAD-dependent oxidoreductase [Terriglobales bacterium]
MASYDATVVGAGPNGLAAAITLAQAGISVQLIEAEASIGGGCRSAELTLPGFVHDICSGIHPFGFASPFFRSLPLEEHGLSWVWSPAVLGHPLDGQDAVFLESAIADTAARLGQDDRAYRNFFSPINNVVKEYLASPGVRPVLKHPLVGARAALASVSSADGFLRRHFSGTEARALLAGMAAHSDLPLDRAGTMGIAVGLAAAAHSGGWPFPRGGAQKLSDALASYFRSLGGTISTGIRVTDAREIPARVVMLDLTPRQIAAVARTKFPAGYVRALERFRYGAAAFKMDWALSGPVPWRCAELGRAATVHLGGSFEEIIAVEKGVSAGAAPETPFMITAQHSLFDTSRAPAGKHTLWAYCHVPNGSDEDMTERMERQVERFAPGFRDTILGRSAHSPRALEAQNANLVGGDFLGGALTLKQLIFRPNWRGYLTPSPDIYLCSASTPPGPGVHGMCGHWAARVALRRRFHLSSGN